MSIYLVFEWFIAWFTFANCSRRQKLHLKLIIYNLCVQSNCSGYQNMTFITTFYFNSFSFGWFFAWFIFANCGRRQKIQLKQIMYNLCAQSNCSGSPQLQQLQYCAPVATNHCSLDHPLHWLLISSAAVESCSQWCRCSLAALKGSSCFQTSIVLANHCSVAAAAQYTTTAHGYICTYIYDSTCRVM